MEKITFYKYQGTGNDFVIIDNRDNVFDKSNLDLVNKLCDRRFGIGADGLILIENHKEFDFELIYFNSDGSKSFCGNGSRCGVAFTKYLGIINDSTVFNAIDGVHEAKIIGEEIHLKMADVNEVEIGEEYFYMNTGSPHYIKYVNNIDDMSIINEARKIRYNNRFKQEGTNVNFVSINGENISMRTYERGVEDETLSCGTGATSVALATAIKSNLKSPINIKVKGGDLKIAFEQQNEQLFTDIWLIGEGKQVFKGEMSL
jgi:diaminopimelate epimerase